jgi:hypothetical protein
MTEPAGRQYFDEVVFKRTVDGRERASQYIDPGEVRIGSLTRPVVETTTPSGGQRSSATN